MTGGADQGPATKDGEAGTPQEQPIRHRQEAAPESSENTRTHEPDGPTDVPKQPTDVLIRAR